MMLARIFMPFHAAAAVLCAALVAESIALDGLGGVDLGAAIAAVANVGVLFVWRALARRELGS